MCNLHTFYSSSAEHSVSLQTSCAASVTQSWGGVKKIGCNSTTDAAIVPKCWQHMLEWLYFVSLRFSWKLHKFKLYFVVELEVVTVTSVTFNVLCVQEWSGINIMNSKTSAPLNMFQLFNLASLQTNKKLRNISNCPRTKENKYACNVEVDHQRMWFRASNSTIKAELHETLCWVRMGILRILVQCEYTRSPSWSEMDGLLLRVYF